MAVGAEEGEIGEAGAVAGAELAGGFGVVKFDEVFSVSPIGALEVEAADLANEGVVSLEEYFFLLGAEFGVVLAGAVDTLQ